MGTGGKGACYGKSGGSSCGAHGAHCLEHPTNGKAECVRSILGGECVRRAFLPPCGIVLDDGVAIEMAKEEKAKSEHTVQLEASARAKVQEAVERARASV